MCEDTIGTGMTVFCDFFSLLRKMQGTLICVLRVELFEIDENVLLSPSNVFKDSVM